MGSPRRARLRRVDPAARQGPLYSAVAAFASSRFGTWLSRRALWGAVVWRLDRVLLRVTHGRLGTSLALPTALLETRGARSGRTRTNAVIYFHDGEAVIVVASKAGHPGNPAWFHNACANPDVSLGGQPFRAVLVDDPAERARLWRLAECVFPGFATYRERAGREGREIPILRLITPEPPGLGDHRRS